MGQGVSGHHLNTKDSRSDNKNGKQGILFGEEDSVVDSSIVMHNFLSNIDSLATKYPYRNGKFGNKGNNCQVINTNTPKQTSSDFFTELTAGMDIEPLSNGKGWKAKSEDGTIITYRPVTSTPDSPAIDINDKKSKNPPLKGQKIHFEAKEA